MLGKDNNLWISTLMRRHLFHIAFKVKIVAAQCLQSYSLFTHFSFALKKSVFMLKIFNPIIVGLNLSNN